MKRDNLYDVLLYFEYSADIIIIAQAAPRGDCTIGN